MKLVTEKRWRVRSRVEPEILEAEGADLLVIE
jgi:hypothetical protein